jgi:hypothetical protein
MKTNSPLTVEKAKELTDAMNAYRAAEEAAIVKRLPIGIKMQVLTFGASTVACSNTQKGMIKPNQLERRIIVDQQVGYAFSHM